MPKRPELTSAVERDIASMRPGERAAVAGVVEALVLAEEGAAYLKVDRRALDEPALERVIASA